MADYWPLPDTGANKIYVYAGHTAIIKRTPPATISMTDYVNNTFTDVWYVTLDRASGNVSEYADYVDGKLYTYDPGKAIPWGVVMSVGDSLNGQWGSASFGFGSESINLNAHYDTYVVPTSGTVFKDVLQISVLQIAHDGSSTHAIYYLAKGFGFVNIGYYDSTWKTLQGNDYLMKSCTATSDSQTSC